MFILLHFTLFIVFLSNVIDVSAVEPHSLEKEEFLERSRQYQYVPPFFSYYPLELVAIGELIKIKLKFTFVILPLK